MNKVHGLQWWAQRLYGMSYIELNDEQAKNVFDTRWEEEESGEKRESESIPSDGSSPSQSITQ